jgi:hypothetical protein
MTAKLAFRNSFWDSGGHPSVLRPAGSVSHSAATRSGPYQTGSMEVRSLSQAKAETDVLNNPSCEATNTAHASR